MYVDSIVCKGMYTDLDGMRERKGGRKTEREREREGGEREGERKRQTDRQTDNMGQSVV